MKKDAVGRQRVDVLMVRARAWVCALPVSSVIEVMRPLPIQAIAGAPRFVLGMSVVRGDVTPVLALDTLLGASDATKPKRFILVRVGDRKAVLATDQILGTDRINLQRMHDAPGLLSEALPTDVARMGVLDRSVLVTLETGRLLSEDMWRTLDAVGAAAP